VIHRNGYFLHKYTTLGHLASSWHPWTIDGKPVLPIQQDETALVLWALREHFETYRDVEFLKPVYTQLVAQPSTWLLEHRDHNGLPKASWDLWEERRGVHTFTVAATIGALQASAKFAAEVGDTERAAVLEEAAEQMRSALLRFFWNAAESRFARMAIPDSDGYRLDMTRDSANYALFAFGALRPGNPMVVSEMQSLRDRLWVRTPVGGCARYERDYFHQVERTKTDEVAGNPWVICTLWHAQHAIATARSADELRAAVPYLEWMVGRARPSGVLAEQYHPYTGDPISVCPLTWSHATVVTTVVQYVRKYEALLAETRKRRRDDVRTPN
jgi:GH15 family glucan-1,4-alpha-glucosidase